MVSILAEVESFHLAGEQQKAAEGFTVGTKKKDVCSEEDGSTVCHQLHSVEINDKHLYSMLSGRGRREIAGLLVGIILLKSQQADQC